jgi:hypothetical protein
MPRKSIMFAFLLAILISIPGFVNGQAGFGSIAGTVSDQSGGVVPGAEVTATNLETNAKATAITSDFGTFQLLQLLPGRYSVAAGMAGFKTVEISGIVVHVADKLTVDLKLEVGEIGQVVTVDADTVPLLRTRDAQTGEVVTYQALQNLPQLNRDPLQLLVIAGNVGGSGERANPDKDTRINGGRTGNIEYFVDGMVAGTGIGHEVSSVTPSMEAVAEFKVITNGYAAEYGRFSGGAVELVTRSGSNALHGQVYEYIQNDVFDANTWNQNRLGGERVKFRQHTFGFTVGGPVWLPKVYNGKNKTFFFMNYDGFLRNQAGELKTANVMTERERAGDFSQTLYNNTPAELYYMQGPYANEEVSDPNDPGKTITQTVRTARIPNNILPENMISPVSRGILKYLPLPNRAAQPGTSYVENYQAPQDQNSNNDAIGIRLDHHITDSQSIFGRFNLLNTSYGATRWRGPLNAAESTLGEDRFGLTLNYDWSINPSWLLNLRTGGFYNPTKTGRLLDPDFVNNDIPFDSETRRLLTERGMPGISTGGLNDMVDSWGWPTENLSASTTYNAAASMTKILDRHTLKFGYEQRRYYDNFINGSGGQFVFLGTPFNRIVGDKSWSNMDNANAPAAFMYGYNSYAMVTGSSSRALNMNYHAAYLQDDFKLTPNLTLNVGVRWDMETPITERFDKLYFWDPDAPAPFTLKAGYNFTQELQNAGYTAAEIAKIAKPDWLDKGFPQGAIRITNTPEHPSRKGQSYAPWQFAPRLGAAYRMADRTVLRASVAQIYFSTTGDAGAFSTGAQGITLGDAADAGWHSSDDNFKTLTSHWSNPFNEQGAISRYQRDTRVANYQATGTTGAAAFYNKAKMPYEWNWSLGVQREVGNGMMVEATYAGNAGRDLLGPDLISHFPKELYKSEYSSIYTGRNVANPFNEDVREYGAEMPLGLFSYPYPYYGPVRVIGAPVGRSNYHSMNLRAVRQGVDYNLTLNYTLGNLKDNVGGNNAGVGGQALGTGGTGSKAYQSVETVREVYGLSPLDEKHVLTMSFNVQLPFGTGRRFLSSPTGHGFGGKLLDSVVGGWEFAGLARYRSGRPVIFDHSTEGNGNGMRVEVLFHSWADPKNQNAVNPNYTGNHGDYVFPSTPPTGVQRALLKESISVATPFVYGTLPAVYGDFRHPGRINEDFSLMKKFGLGFREDTFLQIRLESHNILNRAGYDDYVTNVRDDYFGLIRSKNRYSPRRMQLSARIVF